MKISIICKTKEWQVERLKEEAKKLSVEIEVLDILSADSLPKGLGEIIIWRSSSLGTGENRFKMMSAMTNGYFLINRCLARLPQATEKSFQQEYIQRETTSINCIPTFQFQTKKEVAAAIQKKILRIPFILKPNKGSKGEGVELINNTDELDRIEKPLEKLVFQNFIQNSGDYRVFILGGRVLGAIKRTAKEGGFLNNISKGGSAEMITDTKTLSALRHIGTTVASIFELTICGVDVIYDEIERKFFFLEVNTVPQWKGFHEATGINVAKEIILFCKRLANRTARPVNALILEEYDSQIHLLAGKRFHFLSRLFLWTRKSKYKELLDGLKKNYIGDTKSEHKKILREIYATQMEHGTRMIAREDRLKYFAKYPQLEPCLNLLFKNLFAKKIYDIDLRPAIKEIVTDNDLITLKKNLEGDVSALQILSTHAINYLYLLEFYLEIEEKKTDPQYYLKIGNLYPENAFELQLYFFTHCIIGASRFYSEKIQEDDLGVYIEMLKGAERIINNHFQKISLDNKFEFLVCARLCNFQPSIENKILNEAARSLSPDANFLIDTENLTAAQGERNDFVGAEHRNVLYIMSQTPFHLHIK